MLIRVQARFVGNQLKPRSHQLGRQLRHQREPTHCKVNDTQSINPSTKPEAENGYNFWRHFFVCNFWRQFLQSSPSSTGRIKWYQEMCLCHICVINASEIAFSAAMSGPCVTALRLASTGKNVPTGGQPEEGRQCAEGDNGRGGVGAGEGCRIPYWLVSIAQ